MKPLYFDNAATTKPDKEILKNACEVVSEEFYNPSALYREGLKARAAVESAREILCGIYRGKKLVFTSCGTEADDTAIMSFARHGNVVTSMGEHSAVYKTFETLKQRGLEVRYAKLKYGGKVDEDDLYSKIDEKTSFVSIVHVNNETGAVNDINRIAANVKKINGRVVFHTDAVQSFLKIPFMPNDSVDLLSVSAHKICALKGTGAIYYGPKMHINPYIIGGGLEGGIRSGTENTLGIKVFADAALKYGKDISANYDRIADIKKAFINRLDKRYFKIISPENSSPYVLSFSALSLRSETIMNVMDDEGFIIGKGSACSSKAPHSRVLTAFENDKRVLDGAMRISFIFDTNKEDALLCADKLNEVVAKLYQKINGKI